mgnify:CR=1 FL=1
MVSARKLQHCRVTPLVCHGPHSFSYFFSYRVSATLTRVSHAISFHPRANMALGFFYLARLMYSQALKAATFDLLSLWLPSACADV